MECQSLRHGEPAREEEPLTEPLDLAGLGLTLAPPLCTGGGGLETFFGTAESPEGVEGEGLS